MADDLAAPIDRHIAEYGPSTAAAIIAALGGDAERISTTMARLLDAHRLVVAGMTRNGDPLYDMAADGNERAIARKAVAPRQGEVEGDG